MKEETTPVLEQILVTEDNSIKKVMQNIDTSGLGMAIIVDNLQRLVGMVTDGDIRRGILRGIDVSENVSKIVNRKCVYVKNYLFTDKLIQEIKSRKIKIVPCVNDNLELKDVVLFPHTLFSEPVLMPKSISGNQLNEEWKKVSPIFKSIKRVLVIGGAGYIGSVLVRKLLAKNYGVTILDKFIYGKDAVKDIESADNLRIIEGDTRHLEDVIASIQDVDAVVHLAELVGDQACAINPSTTQEINHLATKAIALVCKYFQVNRLIYTSSCSVYGASIGDQLLDEGSPINPLSLYAKMKVAAEQALMEIKDENFSPVILRLATVFGSSARPRFDLVVNLLTAKAIKDKKITIHGGEQWRPHVHVADVADAIVSVLEAPLKLVAGQIFNVGSEENNHTIDQLGEIIKLIIPSTELVRDKAAIDNRSYRVNFSKLRKILTVQMNFSVVDGVKEVQEVLLRNENLNYVDAQYNNFNYLKLMSEEKKENIL